MNLTADLLGPAWRWAALALGGALLLQAGRDARWSWLSDSGRLNVFLGSVVSLVLLWSIRTGIRPGLGFRAEAPSARACLSALAAVVRAGSTPKLLRQSGLLLPGAARATLGCARAPAAPPAAAAA